MTCPDCGVPMPARAPAAHLPTCPHHPRHREDRHTTNTDAARDFERVRALRADDYDEPEEGP